MSRLSSEPKSVDAPDAKPSEFGDDKALEAEVRKKFERLDADHNGVLTYEEMSRFLRMLDAKLSEKDLQQLFCDIDVDRNGSVDVEEFLAFMLDGTKSSPTLPFEPAQGEPTLDGIREEWVTATLDSHNHFRSAHGCPPLTWSDECYLSAKKQADACQDRHGIFHDNMEGPSGTHGQNIFWTGSQPGSASTCVRSWYIEMVDPGYNFKKPGYTRGTGQFAQVVWKGTTSVGMATSEDGKFVVANYFPTGNVMGAYPENVLARTSTYDRTEPIEHMMACDTASHAKRALSAPLRETVAHRAAAAKFEEVSAPEKGMTPHIKAALEGCPFPFEGKIKEAFAAGGEVVVKRKDVDGTASIEVIIEQDGKTSKMRGCWGSGCR